MHELYNTNSPTIKGLAALFQDEYRYSQFFRDDSAAHLMTELMAKRTIEQADAGMRRLTFGRGTPWRAWYCAIRRTLPNLALKAMSLSLR